jgi:hypothetical protein
LDDKKVDRNVPKPYGRQQVGGVIRGTLLVFVLARLPIALLPGTITAKATVLGDR